MSDSIKILFEGEGVIAVHKPAGVLVHVFAHQKNEKGPTVVQWALKKFPEIKKVGDDTQFRPGIVHRLDRETSGVLLLARTQKAFAYLKSLFQKQEIQKTYYAIVQGVPKEKKGVIDYPIGIKRGTTKRTIHPSAHGAQKELKRAKEAITEYEVVRTFQKDGEKFSLVKVCPKTGRTHQIRIHLNAMHTPVVGDKLYGGKTNSLRAERHLLHCASLQFRLPSGKELAVESPLPEEFGNFDKNGLLG
jgi:RluA family pseudouridine synthase